jgi:hypothetical protein
VRLIMAQRAPVRLQCECESGRSVELNAESNVFRRGRRISLGTRAGRIFRENSDDEQQLATPTNSSIFLQIGIKSAISRARSASDE